MAGSFLANDGCVRVDADRWRRERASSEIVAVD
jgi:hypothetical protein